MGREELNPKSSPSIGWPQARAANYRASPISTAARAPQTFPRPLFCALEAGVSAEASHWFRPMSCGFLAACSLPECLEAPRPARRRWA